MSIPNLGVLDALFVRLDQPSVLASPSPEPSRIEEEWTRDEKQTVEEFTRRQLQVLRQQQAQIEKQRDDVIRRQHALNEACLLKQQEIGLRLRAVEEKEALLTVRERDCGEQERTLLVEQQRLERAKQDLIQSKRETAEQQEECERVRAETQRLLDCEERTRRELEEIEQRLRGHRMTEAEIERRTAELQRREQRLAEMLDRLTRAVGA